MPLGTEWLTSNTEVAYPFRDDRLGLTRDAAVHGATATLPVGIFVDAAISVPPSVEDCYLDSVSVAGTTVTFVFTKHGGAAFPGGGSLSVDYSTLALAHTSMLIPLEDTDERIAIRFVVHTQTFLTWVASIPGTDTYDLRLQFLPALVETNPLSVWSIELYGDGLDNPATSGLITDRVKILPGYNIAIEDTDTTELDTKVLELDVVPGAGDGLAPCEAVTVDPQPLKSPIIADSAGNVNIEGDECYEIIPLADLGVVQVHGVCDACCSCQDYENVLEALRVLFDRAKLAHCYLVDAHKGPGSLTAAHCTAPIVAPVTTPFSSIDASYDLGVTRFNPWATERMKPVLTVNGMRGAAYSGAGSSAVGSPQYVTFTASLKNNYKEDIEIDAGSFSYTVITPSPTPVMLENYLAWEYNETSSSGMPAALVAMTIARGKTIQVYINLRTDDGTALAAASIRVDAAVRVVSTPAITWALDATAVV